MLGALFQFEEVVSLWLNLCIVLVPFSYLVKKEDASESNVHYTTTLKIGLGLGLLGGFTGSRLAGGAGPAPTAVIALLVIALIAHVESGMPALPGQLDENTRATTLTFAAFLGAAVGSGASAQVRSVARRRH